MRKMLSKLLALTLCVALGLGLVGGAFAADGDETLVATPYAASGATFDLETLCTDDGQYVVGATIHLEEAAEATEEELKAAFTVSIKDYYQWFYFVAIEGDFEREVSKATLSEDGKTVTLTLPIPNDFFTGLAAKADWPFYTETGYVVTANTAIGGLEEGDTITYSGVSVDPLADKWGAVEVDETAGTYNYRWYDPAADGYTKPAGGYPIIVWLHGAGEVGTEDNGYDNNLQITANRVTAWGEPETQELFGGAYVLAPQTGKVGDPLAFGWTPENVMKTIEAFIAKVGEDNVNRDKIVIGGCSMGGAGTWNTIKAYPDYFAAAFPVCGSATNFDYAATLPTEKLIELKTMPIYAIHTVEDGTVNILGTLNAYNDLTGVGKSNFYMALYEHTWTPGTPDETEEDIANLAMNGHSSWIYAHNDIDGEKEADKYFMDEYTAADGNTYKSTKPADLGYTSFKAWLAAQVRPTGVRFTVDRTVAAFGEVVTGVTISGLDRISALVKDDEWFTDNKVVVTVKDVAVTDMVAGTTEIKDIVRTPSAKVINDDRTSVTLTFDEGQAFVEPENGANNKYSVTLNGKAVQYAGDTGDASKFESVTYTVPEYSCFGTPKTTMDARYFVPDKEAYPDEGDGYALIVWLHGGGEIGTDNRIQITANDVPAWTEKASQDIFGGAYVLAPQNHAACGLGAPAATMSLIQQFIEEMGDVNVGRLYIGGCSYGGIGTWEMIRNYPFDFSAAFPICCGPTGGLTADEATRLTNLPIYMTVSTGDSAGIVSGMIQAYNDITAAGGEMVHFAMFEHSEYPGCETLSALGVYIDHFSWTYVHNDYDAKGDDYDGKNFIDPSVDGEYNDGAAVVKEGILTYTWTEGEGDEAVEKSIVLNGAIERPEDAGYATFKTWMANQWWPCDWIEVVRDVTGYGEIVSELHVWSDDGFAESDADNVTVKVTAGFFDPATFSSNVETKEAEIESVEIVEDGHIAVIKLVRDGFMGGFTSTAYHGYEINIGDKEPITRVKSDVSPDVDQFDKVTYTVPEYDYNGTQTTMSARAFTPDKETYTSGKYPLVIWLHGVGELGTDNRIQISANDVPLWAEKATQDIFGGAYVLAIQNHAAVSVDACMSVIQQFVAANDDIDPTRIYIGGCSMGGGATWSMIKSYPNYFAAAFPTCMGGSLTEEDVENLKDMPIYMTVSSGDSAGIVTGMIESYNQLKAAGSDKVFISIFEHSVCEGIEALAGVLDHWSWIYTHEDYTTEGEGNSAKYFIDTTVDGEYNDGKTVVKDGVLTYTDTVTTDYFGNTLEEPIVYTATLDGANCRPADTGYETMKTFIAAQVNEKPSVFKDVDGTNENYEAIMALYAAGLTKGTSATTYEPDANMTRAEFMTFLSRAAQATVATKPVLEFTDCVEDWYFGPIAWGVQNGLLLGYAGEDGEPNGLFGPNDPVTTEQVNLIVGRLLENVSGFTAADGQTFENADDTPATRGQIASIINALATNYSAPVAWW